MLTGQKNKQIIISLIVCLFIAFNHVYGTVPKWIGQQPFYSTRIMCMVKHPGGKIFVGTLSDGIYSSDDNGKSWNQRYHFTTNILKPIYQAMFIDNSGNIYASGAEEGLIKSADVGNTWKNCHFPKNQGVIFSITGDNDGNIYTGSTKGVFFSSDGGTTWVKVLDTGDIIVRNLIFKNNVIYAFVDQIGMYATKDKGKNWSFSHLPQSSYWGALVVDEKNIYVAMHHPIPWFAQGIYKTTNGGENWIKVIEGLSTDQINTLAINSDNSLIAGGILGRVFKLVNGGINWTELSSANTIRQINSLLINGNQIIAGTDGGGAIITENEGTNWQISNAGFPKSPIKAAIKINDNAFLVANSAGIFRYNVSTNKYMATNNVEFNGSNNIFGNYIEQEFNGFAKIDNNSIFVCSYQGSVFKWDQTRDIWSNVSIPNYPCMISSFDKKHNGLYITALGSSYAIYHSNDNGLTWESFGYNIRQCNSVAVDKIKNTIWAGNFAYLFYSNDNGANWDFNRHNFNGKILDIEISESNDIYVLAAGLLEKSTDNGISWVSYPSYNAFQLMEIKNGSFLLATQNGLYESTDNGNSWSKRQDDLKDTPIKKIVKDSDGSIYIITDNDIYNLEYSSNITAIENNDLPKTFNLFQNYPNPFNPATVIRYALPESEHVTLKVYNILSQEVADLINENQSAGIHQVNFNASSLPTGIYIARLHAGAKTMSIKLQLVK